MKYLARLSLFILIVSLCLAGPEALKAQDISTLLMNSTFKIHGPAKGGTSTGTIFILGRPLTSDPKRGAYVLVTAAHVLDEIEGDDATLELRKRSPDGTYVAYPQTVKIRTFGQPNYQKNPDADVVAMYVNIPADAAVDLLPMTLLADDAQLQQLEIHPGDELLCLGFPLAIDFDTFPVIRSGLLASYPLTPARTVKTFYYNFHVFPGNSGGPVYFTYSNRVYKGALQIGLVQGIIGLVAQELSSSQPGYESANLDMAKIIPSSFVIDTINLLPEPSVAASPTTFISPSTNKPASHP